MIAKYNRAIYSSPFDSLFERKNTFIEDGEFVLVFSLEIVLDLRHGKLINADVVMGDLPVK